MLVPHQVREGMDHHPLASSGTASPEWLVAEGEEFHHGESDLGSDCDLHGHVLEVDRPVALVRGR
jgi:hypothetical protein